VRIGLCRISLDGCGAGVLAGAEDALAEQREAGAAVHLAFDQLGAGVEAFDRAGVPGQGQAVEDGLVVPADALGEGAQLGAGGAGVDVVEPGGEAGAVQAGEDLGELGDVPGQGAEFGAAAEDGGEGGGPVGVEAGGVGQDPAGDLAGGRRGGRGRRGGQAEQAGVAVGGAVAAGVAGRGDLLVQGADAGGALVPSLAQVRFPGVQAGCAAGGGEQVPGGGGAPVPAGDLDAQAERGGGPGRVSAGGPQLADRGVPFADDRFQVAGRLSPVLVSLAGAAAGARRGLGEAVLVAGGGLAGVFAQVVPQVPPVGDLGRVRGAGRRGLGVGAELVNFSV
jgi:hypothetical protein